MINKTCFTYHGFRFEPYKTLHGKEASFEYISRHIASDRTSLKMSDYNDRTNNVLWNYEDFYNESTDRQADIFMCLDDGKLYIPGEHELFRYIES